MRRAITRHVSRSLERCLVRADPRPQIDVGRAREQHAQYREALAQMGCRVELLGEMPALADAVFVEDTAIVLDEIAVMTRPGHPSRRPEVDTVAAALRVHRTLVRISEPATLDGGDVLRLGREVLVGCSDRTGDVGVQALRTSVAEFGYRVASVKVRGGLHLKSAVTALPGGALLLNPRWVDPEAFGGRAWIAVAEEEPEAANVLTIGDVVLCAAGFPRTIARLRDRGVETLAVDVSELRKCDSGLTCMSLLVDDAEPCDKSAAPCDAVPSAS